MDKRLKTGLFFMIAAVVIMPLPIFMKDSHRGLALGLLIFTMLLELSGLIFVISSILRRRKI